MIDPEERVLDVALERMFADDAASSDASERILAAWRRGGQGSGLADLDLSSQEHGSHAPEAAAVSQPHPELARRFHLWRLAATLLLVGGGFAIWAARRTGRAGPHLVASRSIAVSDESVASDGTSGRRRTRTVSSGQLVIVDGGDGAEFDWNDDRHTARAHVVAAAKTAFRWTADVVTLDAGELTVERTGRPVEVALADARVFLGAGAAVVARLVESSAQDGVSGRVIVDVRAGDVSVAYAGVEQVLVAGDVRDLPMDGAAWRRGHAEPFAIQCGDLPRLTGLLTALSPNAWLQQQLEFDRAARGIGEALERDPLLWEIMASRFMEDRGRERRDLPRAYVDFLAWEGSPHALDLARRMWMVAPQSFAEEHLVAFACGGGFEFERELRALLEPGAFSPSSGVLAAAYFARKGDDIGRARLLSASSPGRWDNPSSEMAGWSRALVAGAALNWLGDSEPWGQLGQHLHESLSEAPNGDPILYAGFSLAVADYVALEGRNVLLRVPLNVHLASHYVSMEGRLSSRRKLLDTLEELADRW